MTGIAIDWMCTTWLQKDRHFRPNFTCEIVRKRFTAYGQAQASQVRCSELHSWRASGTQKTSKSLIVRT
eukprot:3505585-Lingulodinium_polyedra.AAC.1